MRIDKDYPEINELKKLELRTLEFLRNQPYIQENFESLARDANSIYDFLKSKESLEKANFKFEGDIDLWINERGKQNKRKIHICFGADISSLKKDKNAYEKVSYYLVICADDTESLKVTRKFHFDYAPPTIKTNRSVPRFHLQYAGELSDKLKRLGYENDHMNPDFSEPRINHYPVTIALLLNFIFCEFANETTKKITERSEWLSLIRKNERRILEPYFKKCCEFFSSRENKSKLFVNDFCYEF